MPVRLTNTPMKEYTALDWPYIPTVDTGGQGAPHSYMVHNQVLSVFPPPDSGTVSTYPQFLLAYYKHPGIRIPASAAGDAMTWDVPPSSLSRWSYSVSGSSSCSLNIRTHRPSLQV